MLFLQPPPFSYLPVPPSSPRPPLPNSSRCTFFSIPSPAFFTGRAPYGRPLRCARVCVCKQVMLFTKGSGPPAAGLLRGSEKILRPRIHHFYARLSKAETCLRNVSCAHIVQIHVSKGFRRQTFIRCQEGVSGAYGSSQSQTCANN